MGNMKAITASTLSSMIFLMLLLSICVVNCGLFETLDALQVHASPLMWTASDSAILNRVTLFPLSQQLWEKNPCIVVPIFNESSPSPAYSFDVPLDHSRDYCLGSQTVTGEGEPNETNETLILDFFAFILVSTIQTSNLFSVSNYSKCQNLPTLRMK